MNIAATGATIDPASVPLTGTGVSTPATVAITPNPLVITLNSVTTDALDPNVNTNVGIATLTNTARAGGSQVAVSSVAVTNDSAHCGHVQPRHEGRAGQLHRCLASPRARRAPSPFATPRTTRSQAATATAAIDASGQVSAVNVTNGARGYTYTPTVILVDGGGSGATASAVVTNGVVTRIDVTNPGSGYTSAPTVIIDATVGGTGKITFTDNAQGSKQQGVLWGIATP